MPVYRFACQACRLVFNTFLNGHHEARRMKCTACSHDKLDIDVPSLCGGTVDDGGGNTAASFYGGHIRSGFG